MPSNLLAKSAQRAAESPLDQSKLFDLAGYNLRQAYILKITPLFHKRMAKYQLRPVDYTVLTLLRLNPNINQKRLAHAINVSPPNLATLLDRLEQRKLLLRQRNPMDKRSQVLVLTPEGERLCAKAEKAVNEIDHEATSTLTEAERVELIRLLQKMFMLQP